MNVSMESQNAVEVVSVVKSYGTQKHKVPVLRNLTMTVPRGSIYGLLGSSGCGKTTLLRCILGRLRVDEGRILTLGKAPGTVGHNVPGRLVGYMPQELALFNEFTIGETLTYFGRLHKMTSAAIKERTIFLVELLNLPSSDRQISQLSGGQQRRASFAIALLQEPALLILDEPTVGVDPLLRQKIWKHLLSIVQTTHTTVIITTHYIEEARQANLVGLMRSGRLLAEELPDVLLLKHKLPTLEDVFLLLCTLDSSHSGETGSPQRAQSPEDQLVSALDSAIVSLRHRRSDVSHSSVRQSNYGTLSTEQENLNAVSFSERASTCRKISWYLPDFWNVCALFMKNLLILSRKIGTLMFEFLLPSFQIIVFCLCIGGDPKHLKVATVNNETGIGMASHMFLDQLDSEMIVQVNYDHDFNGAMHTAKNGDLYGIISMGENFTQDLIARFTHPNATLDGSTIHLYLDMTNEQISLSLHNAVLNAYQAFLRKATELFPMIPRSVSEFPVKVEKPIYGKIDQSFTNFMAPGIVISIPFFMATGLTALSFVLERKQGLLDRSMVAGVGSVEVMIGHIGSQFLVLCVQVLLLLVFTLVVFKIPSEGPIILVILLTLLQGLAGMALGLVISALCTEETSAMQFALGSVYPNLLMSGIIWPTEAMPKWLQYISFCLPLTFPSQAMRDILIRGWDLTYLEVWRGFLMSVGYGWFLMALSAILLTVRRW